MTPNAEVAPAGFVDAQRIQLPGERSELELYRAAGADAEARSANRGVAAELVALAHAEHDASAELRAGVPEGCLEPGARISEVVLRRINPIDEAIGELEPGFAQFVSEIAGSVRWLGFLRQVQRQACDVW